MSCCTGTHHTITLSDDGVVYSFGSNDEYALGLPDRKIVPVPRAIPNLPKIKQVSCGESFTVCVDYEGFMWSFGSNWHGQLGRIGERENLTPQKIEDIPPVQSVSCGRNHTLILTNDENIWSCGDNDYAQLCLGYQTTYEPFSLERKIISIPQQTSHFNILKISAGGIQSLFQNNEGKIFGCGCIGLENPPQLNACLIPNQPPQIIQFFACNSEVCSLFLDEEGKVFFLDYNTVLQQIQNIPPIQSISHIFGNSGSIYMLDFDGNVWSFGDNEKGQLGHGKNILLKNKKKIKKPKKIKHLSNIHQISSGYGFHFLAKNTKNKIFVTGNNYHGQLGFGMLPNREHFSLPIKLSSKLSSIWGTSNDTRKSQAKSARK